MNDRLKYKVFDKDYNEFYDVISFDFDRYIPVVEWRNGKDKKRSAFTGEVPIVQCTGLTDSTGKLIFEGDIVKTANGDIGIIKNGEHKDEEIIELEDYTNEEYYTDGFLSVGYFVSHIHTESNISLNNRTEKWTTIIGNIYQNPELLEVRK